MNDDLVSSGIGALDRFLDGGLPRGFTTLMLAPTGSGVELFAKQFAANHAKERVTFITTDEPERDIRRAVKDIGWDFSNVEIVDLQAHFMDSVLDSQQRKRARESGNERMLASKPKFDPRDLVKSDSRDLMPSRSRQAENRSIREEAAAGTNYLESLLEPFTGLKGPDRVVVDSLDFFLNLYPAEEVVTTLHAVKGANANNGGQVLLILSKGAHDATTERRLELMADCLIELEMTRKGTNFERFFMVKKVKNRSRAVGVSTYDISEQGFELETLERIV